MPHGHKSENAVNIPTVANEETRNIATIFPGIPANFSGMYTYQRELDEEV